MKIVYVHGFNSTGKGITATKLKEIYKNNLISPTYPFIDADKSFEFLDDIIKKEISEDKVIIVGTSLGGFWANYFSEKYNLDCVLINPSLYPNKTTTKYLGTNRNFITNEEYKYTLDEVKKYNKYITETVTSKKVVLLSVNDEVLDYKIAFEHFKDKCYVILNGEEKHQFKNINEIKKAIDKVGEYE